MKKILKYAMLSLAIALVFTASGAYAAAPAGGNVFATVMKRMLVTFQNSRSVIFIVGGFGLIGLGFAAIFGKVNWKWLAALACGLAIVAVAGQVVDYVTRDAGQGTYDAGGANLGSTLAGAADGTGGNYGQTTGAGQYIGFN